jgi:DNA-binding SARP family transcriptional activator
MTGEVSINVLGAWEVRVDGQPVFVPSGQLRTLLAALLLAGDQPVSVGALAGQLWPDRPPARSRGTLHTYVTRLRRLLGHDLIRTTPGSGYQLDTTACDVDLYRFRDGLREAAAAGSAEHELAALHDVLALWRGTPFGELASTWLDRDVVPRLTEEWFAATERRIDLELDTGYPGRLIPELWDLTNQYPIRESLWLRLMTALHRAGRRTEALDAYQRVRATLGQELGIDPSEQLVALHRTVLLDGPPPGPPAPRLSSEPGIPRQLPHDLATFTGRAAELAALAALPGGAGAGPTVISIVGEPGAGKTALAVHWSHRLAAACPDGQLYLDLQGYGPAEPVAPGAATEILLRGLGIASAQIPRRVQDRSALLRTTVAERRVLILLDNARDADQVRPLLPGTGGVVVVTSRDQLRGLSIRDGARRLTVRRPDEACALALFAAVVGPERLAAEPVAAAQLVRLCDRLPLAIAIVAERTRRTDSMAGLVDELSPSADRLDGLSSGESDGRTDLRTVLSWSYRALGSAAATLLRRLSLCPTSEISLETAAILADLPVPRAAELMDQLVAAHLVEPRQPQRYAVPELIRLYADDLAHRHDPAADRDAAARRVLGRHLTAQPCDGDRQLSRPARAPVAPLRAATQPPAFTPKMSPKTGRAS